VDDPPPISALLARYQTDHHFANGDRAKSMKDATATTVEKIGLRRKVRPSSNELALHRCYGAIGISAVVAAVRYQGTAKNPAYAPVTINSKDDAHAAVIT
jgi:hypothetical protein